MQKEQKTQKPTYMVNGKEVSWDEIPPEIKQYLKDADGDQVPDILQKLQSGDTMGVIKEAFSTYKSATKSGMALPKPPKVTSKMSSGIHTSSWWRNFILVVLVGVLIYFLVRGF